MTWVGATPVIGSVAQGSATPRRGEALSVPGMPGFQWRLGDATVGDVRQPQATRSIDGTGRRQTRQNNAPGGAQPMLILACSRGEAAALPENAALARCSSFIIRLSSLCQ